MKAIVLAVLAVVVTAQPNQYKPGHPPAYGAPAYEHPPQPYEFGYEVDDGYGNKQTRAETQDSYGNQKGSYSYVDAYGLYRTVEYTADATGFRANVKTNEPGTKNENPADVYMYAIEPPAQLYQPAPYQPAPYQPAPYKPAPYQPAPHKPAPYQAAPAPYPVRPAPYQAPAPAYEPPKYQPSPAAYPAQRGYQGQSYSAPSVRVYNNRPQQEYRQEPSYKPAEPEYKPSYKPQTYQPPPKQYEPAPAPYPAPRPQYQPAPAPQYEAPQPQYEQPPPQYEQAAPQPSYSPAPANYGPQRQYAAAAVRAAVQRPNYAGQARRHPNKRQAHDPAYSGDIEVSNSAPARVNLMPSVEYTEA